MLLKLFLLPLFLVFFMTSSQACNIDIYANEQMKPKVYVEAGKPAGILVEMMLFVGEDIGCQFNFKFSTWARAYKSMLDGDGGVIGLSKTVNREKIIDYSDVMYVEDILLVTHIDTAFDYNDIYDLAGKTVASSRGANIGDEFELAVENKLFTLVLDNGVLAKRLERVAKGRVDVAIVSPGKYAFDNVFINHPHLLRFKDDLYIVPTVLRKDPNYLGFSKQHDHQAFLKKFNQSMEKAHKSGIFQAIEEKYHRLQQ